MDWRWSWFWGIIWSLCIHLITLNWSELQRDGDNLKGWWQSLWDEIAGRIDGAKSWVQGYAFGLYVQALAWINSQVDWVKGRLSWLQGYAFGLYVQAVNWINDRINWIRGFAESLYWQARGFAQAIVDGLRNWVIPWVQSWVNYIRSWYDWIQGYRSLITGWLMQARAVIDWLWHQAWGQLQAFLRDPIGYVLGWLLNPIRNFVNWWQRYGPLLMTFVANELAALYTLWTNGRRILEALVDDPEGFVLDLLAPMFIDWLAGLIADNW